MPRTFRRSKKWLDKLTMAQELELIIGPRPGRSAFDSDDDRKAAWLAFRERILELRADPWAARTYENR